MNAKRQFLQTAVRGAAALFASSAVGHSSLNRVWSGQAVSTAPSPPRPVEYRSRFGVSRN